MEDRRSTDGLARCHGYHVAYGDVVIGAVETPIFGGPFIDPEFLLVRTPELPGGRPFRVLPASLVVDVDPVARRVGVVVDGEQLTALPARLPLSDGQPAGGSW